MIVVIDSNILFSACIAAEKKNRITEVLYNQVYHWRKISCYYAISELFRHQEKLIKASKLTADKLSVLLYETLKQVEFFNEDTIDEVNWLEADRLTKGVDSKDVSFVALALQTNGILWTGDKKLITHLKAMGFDRVVDTGQLYDIFKIG